MNRQVVIYQTDVVSPSDVKSTSVVNLLDTIDGAVSCRSMFLDQYNVEPKEFLYRLKASLSHFALQHAIHVHANNNAR